MVKSCAAVSMFEGLCRQQQFRGAILSVSYRTKGATVCRGGGWLCHRTMVGLQLSVQVCCADKKYFIISVLFQRPYM